MKKLVFIPLLLLAVSGFAQKMPYIDQYKIRWSDTASNVVFEIKPSSETSTKPNKNYYWYGSNNIHITQGGYSGKLLNGSYVEYYPNKNIKTQGIFVDGLKNNTWKTWHSNGNLKEIITWNHGIMDGKFSLYDENGRLKEAGQYAENQLNGRITFYDKDTLRMVRYKSGLIVSEKESFLNTEYKYFKKWLHGKAATDTARKQKSTR